MEKCRHLNIKTEYMEAGHAHHGKRVCEDCNKFLRWIPKTKYQGDKGDRANQVFRLQRNYPLTEFERNFVSSIERYQFLTPAQEKVYQRIVDKYFQ